MTRFAPVAVALLNVAVLSAGSVQMPGAQGPNHAKTTCTEIAALATQLSGLEVRVSNGVIRDDKAGSTHDGCRVVGTARGVEYRDNKWPHDILRTRMMSDDWREDITRAADGAGSTAFALRKGISLCLWSAVWSTRDQSGSEAPTTASYTLEVGCFETHEARGAS